MGRSLFIYGVVALLCLSVVPVQGALTATDPTAGATATLGDAPSPADHAPCETVPDHYPCGGNHETDETGSEETETPAEETGDETPTESGTTGENGNDGSNNGGTDDSLLPEVQIPSPLSVDLSPPNAREIVTSVARDGQSAIHGGMVDTIDTANSHLFSLPAPGQPTEPGTWVNPDRGWWTGVMDAYWLFGFVGVLMLIPWAMLGMDQDARRQRDTMRRVAIAFGMILAGPVVMPMGYHLGSVLAQAIAPSGSEFLQTPGDLSRLGIGIGMALLIAFINLAGVLLGVIAYYTLYVIAFFVAALWPLYWGLYASPFRTLQTAGSVGLGAYMTIPVIVIAQTAVLRILFSLPLSGLDIITSVIVTVGGLFAAFFVLPRMLFNRLTPRAVSAMSRSIDEQTVDRIKQKREEISRGLRQKFQEARPGVRSGVQGIRSRVSGSSAAQGRASVPHQRQLPAKRTPRLPDGNPEETQPALPAAKPANRPDGDPRPTPQQRRRKRRRIDQATDSDRFSS